MPLPTWIFFDCFNTLLDDFDDAGDESGIGSIARHPVEAAFCKLGMQALHLDRSALRPAPPSPPGIRSITHWDQFRPDVFGT